MKKLALVLGGGAAKGYAHIGVLKVLERNGIKPDLIVGTSMGALVGGMYSAGKTIDEIVNLATKFTSIGNFSIYDTLFKGCLLNTKKVKKLLLRELGEFQAEDCVIPFVSIATDMDTGLETRLNTGKLMDNILASISVPSVFPMYKIGKHRYCDGGLVNNLAEDVARELLPDAVVISIDPIGDYDKQVEHLKMKTIESALNASTILTTGIIKRRGNMADLRITISQPYTSQIDFSKKTTESTIRRGQAYTKKYIEEIKNLLGVSNDNNKRNNQKCKKC